MKNDIHNITSNRTGSNRAESGNDTAKIKLFFSTGEKNRWIFVSTLMTILLTFFLWGCFSGCSRTDTQLKFIYISTSNFDSDFLQEYEDHFVNYYKLKTGQSVQIWHCSDDIAPAPFIVRDGLDVDILWYFDLQLMNIPGVRHTSSCWQTYRPNNSCPCGSVPVFAVQRGNPKKIQSWNDLLRPDVHILLPDPRTDSAGRHAFLAIWYSVLQKELQSIGGIKSIDNPVKKTLTEPARQKAFDFLKKIYTKAQKQGLALNTEWINAQFLKSEDIDVCLIWEYQAVNSKENKRKLIDIVYPENSILCDFPITASSDGVKKHHSSDIVVEFINHLFEPKIQVLLAEHGFRPGDKKILQQFDKRFPEIQLLQADQLDDPQKIWDDFFAPNALCDQIFDSIPLNSIE